MVKLSCAEIKNQDMDFHFSKNVFYCKIIVMKKDRKKSTDKKFLKKRATIFNIFLSYIFFSAIIFVILWIMQTVLISKFYQNVQERNVKKAAVKITNSVDPVTTLCTEVQKAHIMALIYDDTMVVSFVADEHSAPYAMHDRESQHQKEREIHFGNLYRGFASKMFNENLKEYIEKQDVDFNYGMLFPNGKQVLIINAPLGALDFTVTILRNQLIVVVIISLFVAILMSLVLGKRFSDERLQDARIELLANVTHDLRTPLTLIRGYAESLKDFSWEDEESRNHDTEIIIKEADRLTALVNDVLEYSSLKEKKKFRKEQFDFGLLVNQVINQFGNELVIGKIEDDCFVMGNRTQLERVLYNLIDNGIRHSYEGNRVMVTVSHQKNRIRLDVTNFGEPIPKENLPLIWDRYFTFRQQRMGDEKSGLGLAIVKGILENHRALYGVTSSENEGTNFWTELR